MLAAYSVESCSHVRPSPCPLSEPKYLWESKAFPWGKRGGGAGGLLNKCCFLMASILQSMERKYDILGIHADR